MRRALVTGATGLIGSHVALHLRDRGFEVRGLVRPGGTPGSALPDGVEPVHADVRDADAMRRAAEGVDAIFHVAAIYSLSRRRAPEVHAVNVGGTQVVIDIALATGIPMVHTSSVATIGIPGDGTHGDEETLQPSSQVIGAYKRSKVEAESLVRRAVAAGLEAYVVNPSAPIGPGDYRPTPTGHLIVDALSGRIPAYVDTGLNIVDVRDVAAGHLLALERGEPGRRYILGNAWGNMTLREILAMVNRAGGPPPPERRIPHAVAIAAAAVDELVEGRLLRREPRAPLDGALLARKRMFFSPQRAITELGLPQSDLGTAVADAVQWFRERAGARGMVAA
ncbi:MAG: NAD-dependent epimerase/dehydratase family protein [Actinomycetota bacterium]|jgi:dihydroflavonol-4-reductase